MKYISHSSAAPHGLLRKTAAVITTVAAAAVAVMFSAALLALVAVVAVLAMAWLWWKTRELRRHLRNVPPRGAAGEGASDPFQGAGAFRRAAYKGEAFQGEIIEGEVVRVHESREEIRR